MSIHRICLPDLDFAIYVLHPHGCSISHCFLRLLWRGHPASHSGTLQYEHCPEHARHWQSFLSHFSVPLDICHGQTLSAYLFVF